MTRPNLQVALDHSDLPSAIKAIKTVGDIVDIIEVGTILILQAGDQAVRCIRAMYPDKTIVADTKCADAGVPSLKMFRRLVRIGRQSFAAQRFRP